MARDLEELMRLLGSQEFPYRDEFLEAMHRGECSIVGASEGIAAKGAVRSSHLLSTYRVRQAHLATHTSHHARALANDTALLCENLARRPDGVVQIWDVRVSAPYTLIFFLEVGTGTLLGCVRAVSILDVAVKEWDRLWNDHTPTSGPPN